MSDDVQLEATLVGVSNTPWKLSNARDWLSIVPTELSRTQLPPSDLVPVSSSEAAISAPVACAKAAMKFWPA